MKAKSINNEELFNLLDSDGDGFITATEFSENIDKVKLIWRNFNLSNFMKF